MCFIQHYFKNKSFLDDIKNVVIDHLEDLLTVKPNYKQLETLMVDLISIYAQERHEDVHKSENTDSEADSEEDEEAFDVIFNAFNRNFDNIVAMGFEMEEVEVKYLKIYFDL